MMVWHSSPGIRRWPLLIGQLILSGWLGSVAVAQQTTVDARGPSWKVVPVWSQGTPPEWAFWERHVLDQLAPLAEAFVAKYTRDDGTLKWRDEWPGMDGSDDGYESFYNFPLYYALGGDERILRLSEKLWDGVTRQFTGYGQIHKEFDAHYDWMHHGESYTYFYFFGLSAPYRPLHQQRALRFAEMYVGGDALTDNYDPRRKLMRSPLNGSRGPHYENTAEDWVTHRPILAHYPLPFDDIPGVEGSEDWNDDQRFAHILTAINQRMMRGDVPLNLTSTSLMANAYMYSGDDAYRRWVADYVAAWQRRTQENNGVLPDNVGLSGQIGEHMEGRWWGGYYGWQWPHGLFNQVEATMIGATNAYLVSGNADYLELPRSVIDLVSAKGREEQGRTLVPHRHGKSGWYDYRAFPAKYLAHLWFISRHEEDWERLQRLVSLDAWKMLRYSKGKGDSENVGPWLMYVRGGNDRYPLDMLQAGYRESLARMARIRADRTRPAEQDVHHWQKLNPVILEGLVQLTLGCPNHIYHGGLLHSSLRYYDPVAKRPGLPPDVAVLVERLTPSGVRLQLVNLHASESRRVLIQGGMYGEHQVTRVRQVVNYPYQFDTVNAKAFEVELVPGAVGRLEIGLKRFSQRPSYAYPWAANAFPISVTE